MAMEHMVARFKLALRLGAPVVPRAKGAAAGLVSPRRDG